MGVCLIGMEVGLSLVTETFTTVLQWSNQMAKGGNSTTNDDMKGMMCMDAAGMLLGWRTFDHAAHLSGILFGIFWVHLGERRHKKKIWTCFLGGNTKITLISFKWNGSLNIYPRSTHLLTYSLTHLGKTYIFLVVGLLINVFTFYTKKNDYVF